MNDKKSAKEMEEDRKIYNMIRQELIEAKNYNAQMYDKFILTFSTAMLGLSLSFIKNAVPVENTENIILLISSWWLFGGCIILMTLGLMLSPRAVNMELENIEEYYIEDIEESKTKGSVYLNYMSWINNISGALFLAGIVTTILFVSSNIY